jgi:alpha-L-fucosidase 2
MLTTVVAAAATSSPTPAGCLWYTRPASRWFEALPIGNGRLGGMVFGGDLVERIQLSESTVWSGAPATTDVSPTAREQLPRIRELLFTGRYAEAQRLTREHLLGRPTSFGTNLPLPDVRIAFAGTTEVEDYSRRLDLDEAVVSTRYRCDGATFARQVFSSHPDRVLVARLDCDRPGRLSFELSFSPGVIPAQVSTDASGLLLRGNAYESLHSNGRQGVEIEIDVRVVADGGSAQFAEDHVRVIGADAVTLLVAVVTSWDGGADLHARAVETVEAASRKSFDELRTAHVADHGRLMGRVSIDLGPTTADQRSRPTDERRSLVAEGGDDPELLALFFQYGRYLTIAGSREDSPLPLALQGLWNDGLASGASWTNDFHLDVNTQQNYWAAEVTNLAECQAPLFRLVEGLRQAGRSTAAAMYGAPGWVAHTVTNAWGYSAPGSGLGWGMNVTAGAWIALQLWEHFDYGRDLAFLRRQVYPVFRDAAQFFLSYLVAEPTHGWLVTGPSESPENWYLSPDGEQCAVSMGATCDRVFVEALLRICAESAELLGVDDELRARITDARALLPPFQVGRHGQLQEWLFDFDEAVPSHRHTSHLCALYPERQITPRKTPDLARAAEVTIQRRQSAPGWEQTEWVEANLMVYYARLLNGDLALQHLRGLIGDAAEANLLTFSAGGVAGAVQNIYSFDGNAGGAAGIAEMLLQSDGAQIELLPALPASWRHGSVRGLRARGGFTVDLSWRDGRLERARIISALTANTVVRYGDALTCLSLEAGEVADIA